MPTPGRICACLLSISIIATDLFAFESIPTPVFHKKALLNGMEVLFLPGREPRSHFVLMIKGGAAFDPVDKWGVTWLTTRILLEGSRDRPGMGIAEELRQLGADVDFTVGWDAVYLHGSAPAERIGEVLNLLGETVVRPNFSDQGFEKARSELLARVRERESSVQDRTHELFLAEAFRGNPYQHAVEGTPATAGNLQLVDVKILYRKLFIPNQAQLAFYYSGDRDRLFRELSRRWGSWIRRDPVPFTFRPAAPLEQPAVVLLDAPAEETLFRWGHLAVERTHSDYYPMAVLEQYLLLSLPEWAAQVAESQIQGAPRLETLRMPGYLQLTIQAPPRRLAAYLNKVREAVEGLQRGEVDPRRFEEARRLAFDEMARRSSQSLPRLFQLLDTQLYGLGVNFISQYGLRLERVTLEVFRATLAKRLFPERFVLVVAGPVSDLKSRLEPFGPVRILN